jgi:hypothetical protein
MGEVYRALDTNLKRVTAIKREAEVLALEPSRNHPNIANIKQRSDGTAKILDFGLAKRRAPPPPCGIRRSRRTDAAGARRHVRKRS